MGQKKLAILMADHINKGFYKKMQGRFAGWPKKGP